jgi:hypothetical protein
MNRKNHVEKIRQEMTLMEKILSYVPGYRGYKEKEIRRESDRLIRMESANKLREAKNDIRSKLADLANSKKMEDRDMSRIDMLLSRLDRVVERIEKAPAGYVGLFDAVKVREDKLNEVLEHDLMLIEKSVEMRDSAKRFEQLEVREEWMKSIDEMLEKIKELEEIINKRVRILRGLTD